MQACASIPRSYRRRVPSMSAAPRTPFDSDYPQRVSWPTIVYPPPPCYLPISSQVLSASSVGVTTGPRHLLAGMTSGAGCPTAELSVAMELKKLCISSLVRSLGSLFQACDRLVGIPGHGQARTICCGKR